MCIRDSFSIRADRFLRNMVRSIVGTLVDVGRGRYTVGQFRDIVASRDLSRSSAGAPAQGLFLSDVVYPPGVFRRGGGSGLFDGNEKSGMRWDK